jgi:hypothetical protein
MSVLVEHDRMRASLTAARLLVVALAILAFCG